MKKIIKVLGIIFALCMMILFFNGCDNDGVNGTYYELKGKKLDKSSYFVLENEKWSINNELSGTYKLDGDNIILYLNYLEYKEKIDKGTLFNGVLKLEEFGAYCKNENARDYMIDQTELKYEKNNDSYIVTGIKSKDIKNIVIPSTYNNLPVTEIKDSAFKDFTLLKDITLPSSIEHIGKDAFSNCPIEYANIPAIACSYINNINLKEVVINSGDNIPDCSFKDCTLLSNITLPSSIKHIGKEAFYNCTSLTNITIPSSVQSIGKEAFYECTSLIEVNIESLSSWCNIKFDIYTANPLYYAKSNALRINGEEVTEITEEMLDGVTNIPLFAFSGCTSLTNVIIPSSVQNIDGFAFHNCRSLKSITIPSSVKRIGDFAFFNCYLLTEVNYLGTIKDWCNIEFNIITSNPLFYAKSNALRINGKEVTEITEEMLDGVTNIPYYAFSNCTSLTNITIPSSVQRIEESAFMNCTSLTSIILPSSIQLIESYAFSHCTSLTEVNYLGTIKDWCNIKFETNHANSLYNVKSFKINGQDVTEITEITEEMLDGVTILPNCAFCCFSSLRYIAIPSSVECIEYDAFYNCTSLINIIISSNIKKIGFDAFYNCTSLVIYCEVESKPSGWYDEFWYNSNRPIYWGIAKEDIIDQDGMQFIIQDNKAILTRYIGNNKDLTIPSSITIQDKEYSVILGKYAFCNTNVENIIIEDGINIIPDYAFSNCQSLKSVIIPSSVQSIEKYAFNNCDLLSTIIIPSSVERIGHKAFFGCTSLIIYCEAESEPNGWSPSWDGYWDNKVMKVYWKDQWHYKNGVPTTNKYYY